MLLEGDVAISRNYAFYDGNIHHRKVVEKKVSLVNIIMTVPGIGGECHPSSHAWPWELAGQSDIFFVDCEHRCLAHASSPHSNNI